MKQFWKSIFHPRCKYSRELQCLGNYHRLRCCKKCFFLVLFVQIGVCYVDKRWRLKPIRLFIVLFRFVFGLKHWRSSASLCISKINLGFIRDGSRSWLGEEEYNFWTVMVHCLSWSVLMERNSRIFEDQEDSIEECWDKVRNVYSKWENNDF